MRSDLIYWMVVLGSLLATALYLAGPPNGAHVDQLKSAQYLVYFVVFAAGLTIAAAVRLLARGGSETARHSVLWVCMVTVGIFAYSSKSELQSLYRHAKAELYPSVAMTTDPGEAQFRRTWDGHYRVEALVNGVQERLLIDTGASMVLLPFERVDEFGIDPDKLDFNVPVTTANGKSTVAPITIESIKIGPIEVQNVSAAVAHPGRLKMGLLGMSFLDKLEETSFRGDRLILRQ